MGTAVPRVSASGEATRRPAHPHEAAYRASLPDATELAIGRMFRA
jgi:hypothetical protein